MYFVVSQILEEATAGNRQDSPEQAEKCGSCGDSEKDSFTFTELPFCLSAFLSFCLSAFRARRRSA